jgi:ZIP family zinc transporter
MIPTEYLAVILLSFLSIITTIIGVALAFVFKKGQKGISIGIGFSAGIMLLISFFELIPESVIEAGVTETFLSVFFGVLFIGILNLIIPHTHMIKERGKFNSSLLKTAYLVAFGLILHDFPEGFAMANSYIFSPSLGLLIALAIAVHNIPEEFAMAIPLVLTKSKKNFLLKISFLSSIAEPIGAVLGLLAVNLLPHLNALFLSFAAGAMIFISIHELFPLAKRYKRILFFILGVILSIFVYLGLTILIPQ